MLKHIKSKSIKVIVSLILLITLVLTPLFLYWLPRISLELNNEAIYILPPSKNKFISDVIYISKRRGISTRKEIKKFDYKENYSSYSDAVSDLSPYLAENYSNHAEVFYFEKDEEKYPKFVTLPIVSIDSDKVAMIVLPAFSGKTSEDEKFIATVQKFLKTNKNEIKGVIIDLSNNGGGNFDVLTASLSQLLPNGTLFNFVDNENNKFPVKLSDSKISYEEHNYLINSQEKLDVPVAILGSNITASSAEILLLALTNNIKRNIFIGQPTKGLVSGRKSFKLYDNYYLGLPTMAIKTNDGITHKTDEPIVPAIESQAPYDEAKKWLDKIIDK